MSYQPPDPHAANNPQGQNQAPPPPPNPPYYPRSPQANPGYGQQFGGHPPQPPSYQQPKSLYPSQTPFSNLPTQPLPNISSQQGKNRKQSAHRGKSSASKKRQSAWKRVLSIAAIAAVTALVTASFTNLGNAASGLIGNLFSSTGAPVQMTLVRTMPTLGSHAFANAFVPSDTELSQLSSSKLTASGQEAWFTSRRGVDTTTTTIELVVEGNRNYPVRILDIEPIVHCQSPLKGTLFYSPPAGMEPDTQLFFYLDTPDATQGKGVFKTSTFSLQHNERDTFKIVAETSKYFCTFTLTMTVLDENKTVIETITNNGHPFQVTADLDKYPIKQGEFSAYQVLYIGGVMTYPSPSWVRENPNTYDTP